MHYAPAVIVHGGAGARDARLERDQRAEVQAAAALAWERLRQGQSALDVVEAAVRYMEDEPVFNCGTGSVLNWFGEVETDASVMLGDGASGAIGALSEVRYPISVARRVMEETDHQLLCGSGARSFARALGFAPHPLATEVRRAAWKKHRARLMEDDRHRRGAAVEYWEHMRAFHERYRLEPPENPGHPAAEGGTVGAVAMDETGRLAVGTSTGGIMLKLPGRVGDSAIIGAGTYASPNGGASATGHGEAIMRLFLTLRVVDFQQRLPAPTAARRALELASHVNGRCGVICIDRFGRLGRAYNTERMYTAGSNRMGALPADETL